MTYLMRDLFAPESEVPENLYYHFEIRVNFDLFGQKAIAPVVLQREEKEPVALFEEAMRDLAPYWIPSDVYPQMPCNGPYHHGLVPAVLIQSLRNNGYDFGRELVVEAVRRGLMMPAMGCACWGACGAGIGVGIAVSLVLNATIWDDKPRSLAMKAQADTMVEIAKLGGPHCCPLASYRSINSAVSHLKALGYELPKEKLVGRCIFSPTNPNCHKKKCPQYPKSS